MKVIAHTQIWHLWLLLGTVCDGMLINLRGYRSLLVDLHNRYRATERAADMKEMTWDFYLERRAAEWSEQCYWGHQSRGLGENLAMFWTTGPQMSISRIIQQSLKNWWDEKYTWSWDTNFGSAGHYTQMAWAKTNRIGCSLSKCRSLTMDSTENGSGVQNADYLVCFYNPPGNYIGQYPFTPGRNCELCERGEVCRNRLCSSRGGRQNFRYNSRANNGRNYLRFRTRGRQNFGYNSRTNNRGRQNFRYNSLTNNGRNYLPYRTYGRYQDRDVTNWGSESRGSESWGSTREVGEGASEAASEAKELR